MTALNILIVEDVDTKYEDVMFCINACLVDCSYVCSRAKHLNDAEDEVMTAVWDLIVLDLSMDIAAAGSYDISSGHATLGGLDILERMALLQMRMPTVLVTGFDSFQDPDRFDNAIMNLTDVSSLASSWLLSSYLGCVRYGVDKWDEHLTLLLKRWKDDQSTCRT